MIPQQLTKVGNEPSAAERRMHRITHRLVAGLALAGSLTASAYAAALAETDLTVPGPQGPLEGTLRAATGNQAALALIIPGSGPTDRDGNNPLGVKAATYRLLAEALADEGIASVRIDKRGMFASAAAIADANAVTIPDYVADIAHWVRAARTATGAPCVWLIGHSEGGLIALAAAGEVADLCGLVLVATPGRPMGEVIRTQLRAYPFNAPLLAPAEAAIDALTAGERVDAAAIPAPLMPPFNPAVQGFLISAFALDPAQLAARAALPILIVQGAKDLQVPMADAKRLAAAAPSAKLVVLEHSNHVLKDVADDNPASNLATYGNADLPLSAGAASAIVCFIKAQ